MKINYGGITWEIAGESLALVYLRAITESVKGLTRFVNKKDIKSYVCKGCNWTAPVLSDDRLCEKCYGGQK